LKSNFKASQEIIIGAILVSDISPSTSQYDPLIYLSCKQCSKFLALVSLKPLSRIALSGIELRVYCWGLYAMKEWNRSLLQRAEERATEEIFVLHPILFSRKRFK